MNPKKPHIRRLRLRNGAGFVWGLYPYRGAQRPVSMSRDRDKIFEAARRAAAVKPCN